MIQKDFGSYVANFDTSERFIKVELSNQQGVRIDKIVASYLKTGADTFRVGRLIICNKKNPIPLVNVLSELSLNGKILDVAIHSYDQIVDLDFNRGLFGKDVEIFLIAPFSTGDTDSSVTAKMGLLNVFGQNTETGLMGDRKVYIDG